MNLCKDCKHFAQEGNVTNCAATAISLIDGVSRHSVDHCSKARGRNGRCGLEGRLYAALEVVEIPAQEPGKKPARKAREKTAQVAEEAASE